MNALNQTTTVLQPSLNPAEIMSTTTEPWTWQCDKQLPSDTRVGRHVLDEVLRELETQHWPQHDIFCIHLAAYEALINAIVHGNREDVSKKVNFVCRISPHRVHLEIADEGPGFTPESLPDCTDNDHLQHPGGRGVLLMRAFMSRVSFSPDGNRVTLERDRA